MLVHTDHLIPGMRLVNNIKLRAGSFLITRRELNDGVLDEKVIEAIRNFAAQIVPTDHRVNVEDDFLALEALRLPFRQDLARAAKAVKSGKDSPNFLAAPEMEEKVLRMIDSLFSNPDVVRVLYDSRYNSPAEETPATLIIEHTFRVTLLSLALAIKLGGTMFSLANLGLAALVHDLSLFGTPFMSGARSLDELSSDELEAFVARHQIQSALYFSERDMALSPYQKGEILHILANHHRPPLGEQVHRNTLVFHVADLMDEMISPLPHKVRYNFGPLHRVGMERRFVHRESLIVIMSVLTGMGRRFGWQMQQVVTGLIELLNMEQLLDDGYVEKLQEIIKWCPFDSAAVWPPSTGNALPHSVYCGRSLETDFSCKYMLFSKIEVQRDGGKLEELFKCGELGPRLEKLNSGEK